MNQEHPSALKVKDLGLRVNGRWLIRKLSFSIGEGDFLAITGNSGSGKSTLLRCLANHIRPDQGTIEVKSVSKIPCGMIFQDPQLSEGASALNNVLSGSLGRNSFLSTLFRFPQREKEEALELIAALGLQKKIHQWSSTLSGGERQRLAIARTLLAHPQILLADEPVASLDRDSANQALSLMKHSIMGNRGCIVCSLHDHQHVKNHASHELHIDEVEPENWKICPVQSNKV